jgi:hypothetical protein
VGALLFFRVSAVLSFYYENNLYFGHGGGPAAVGRLPQLAAPPGRGFSF